MSNIKSSVLFLSLPPVRARYEKEKVKTIPELQGEVVGTINGRPLLRYDVNGTVDRIYILGEETTVNHERRMGGKVSTTEAYTLIPE